jgi:hypothetical protein
MILEFVNTKATTIEGLPAQKKSHLTVSCSAAQRKIWNLPTKATQFDCICFIRAAKDFGIGQHKSNSS